MDDIVSYFFYAIRKSGYADKLGAGIVITGGTSLLPNMGHLIKFHTGYDVRVGRPNMKTFVSTRNIEDPRFATALGLLKMVSEEDGFDGKKNKRRAKKVKSNEPGILTKMQNKIVQGVIGFFEEVPADTEMT
jgi:cell division protein FtsA